MAEKIDKILFDTLYLITDNESGIKKFHHANMTEKVRKNFSLRYFF